MSLVVTFDKEMTEILTVKEKASFYELTTFLCRRVYIFKTKTNEKCADSTLSKNYCRFIIGRMLQRQTNIYVNLKPVRLKALELENSCMVIVN